MDYRIVRYTENQQELWDRFIEQESINGTFLQQRRFLNYHSKDKFKDVSILFYEQDELIAVVPACEEEENGKRVFYSHKGSTYGGFIIKRSVNRAEKLLHLIQVFEEYLRREGYGKCVLKPTMKLLCEENIDLLEFCLYYNKYTEYEELNLYVDYSTYSMDIMSNLSHRKQRNVKRCMREGVTVREITQKEEIEQFHRILCGNLDKFGVVPVHTAEELWDLYTNRVPDKIKFYAAFLEDKMLAGTMVFLFENVKCAHTQYLAADLEYNKLSPMSMIYYSMAKLYGELGYKSLSWGIASEHRGTEINMGLIQNKEEYGSCYVTNYIYEKEF